jgi:site-specific recombinase XerD
MIEENEYQLYCSKTSSIRLIVLDDKNKQSNLLKDIFAFKKLENSYLFYSNKTQRPMTVSSLTQLLNSYIEKVLGKLYTSHSFRIGYVTKIYKKKDLKTANQAVGHTLMATTARYATVTTEDIAMELSGIDW